MTTKQKTAPKPKSKMVAKPADAADPERSEALAKLALRPSVNAAAVVTQYGKPLGVGEDDIGALMNQLSDDVEKVWAGDMRRAEAMLFGQAHALQAIFMSLSRRANSQEYLKQWEAYLRMALKAQNQCRMTLETLATIKNPPVVIARQANINNGGQQQVNNGAGMSAPSGQQSTHAADMQAAQTELLEQPHGQRLDFGAKSQAGGADPQLATVGAVHRPAHR
jgi:hypothetical protein